MLRHADHQLALQQHFVVIGDAVLIVDETADEKSSVGAAGAARQYSGTVGGIALCQVAVALTYATRLGHALIGRALYLPGACAADEEHRELAGIPEEVMFASKPQLADGLLGRAHARGIRAAFVVGDEVYGGRELRRGIRRRGMGLCDGGPRQPHPDGRGGRHHDGGRSCPHGPRTSTAHVCGSAATPRALASRRRIPFRNTCPLFRNSRRGYRAFVTRPCE
jgi:hypothetical protein